MEVYRICQAKWVTLSASGFPARWNSAGQFAIYTASSMALACLENIVHKGGRGFDDGYKVMTVSFPPALKIEKVTADELPPEWKEFDNPECKRLGDDWLTRNESAILQVPSVIIPQEPNFLLNPRHHDFSKVELKVVEGFIFDHRL